MSTRHVAIVGAGVVGVATAWVLARAGHRVTLIDRRNAPGQGASLGNAAQLSFAYSDAMPSAKLLRQMPRILLGRDDAFRVRGSMDPDFLRWGLGFMLACNGASWTRNTRANLALARTSSQLLPILLEETGVNFGYRQAGKLHLLPDQQSLVTARQNMALKQEFGFAQQILSMSEACALEPALHQYQGDVAGVLHTPYDSVGDAPEFCRNLTAHLREHHGVQVWMNTTVSRIETDATGTRLHGVRFNDREALEADAVVIATGSESHVLRHAAPELGRVWPVRGYSFTVPANEHAPSTSLTDMRRKLAFARIGDRLRVAGLADIGPRGAGFEHKRYDTLVALAMQALPQALPQAPVGAEAWSGERPMSPSSVPIIQASKKIRGLYLNTGHGMLGWTLALGSAAHLHELMRTAEPA